MQRLRRPVSESHGFTLVELMVALSGGLFLSMMVFALSRDTSRFYQRENRLAGAVLAGMNGFERLKTDIARAGYLTTPNILKDPMSCMRPVVGWPPQLASMGSVRIEPDKPILSGNQAINDAGLTPDSILLAGSYNVSDDFPVSAFVPGSTTVFIEANMGALARIGYFKTGLTPTDRTEILKTIFKKGRVLRVTDKAGLMYFGVIQSTVDAGSASAPLPSIELKSSPLLQSAGVTRGCGMIGFATGASANVVNFVRYQIQDLKAATPGRFQPLWDQSAGAPGESTRTELVRQELDADGNVIELGTDLTTELVAEYAVDLGFSVTAQLPASDALVDVQPGDANFASIFNATPSVIGAPQRVRAVRVRLSVRSREADRDTAIAGGLYRIKLPGGDWARVRTFQADVALQNQLDVRWL